MLSLKEILISIFVLLVCLIIFSSHNERTQPVLPQNEVLKESQAGPVLPALQNPQPIPALVWEQVENLNEDKVKNLKSSQDNPQLLEQSSQPEIKNTANQSDNQDKTNPQITPSLKTILVEVENLSSDLWLEFKNIHQKGQQDCPGCSQPESPPPSICATILTSPGAGPCNCSTLGCTPPVGPWCVHPCCCVCCPVCCGL